MSQISKSDCQEISKIMNLKYGAYLKGRTFATEASTDSDTALVTVTLKNNDESFFYPVQARYAADKSEDDKESIHNAALAMIDYIDYYFEDYFKEDEDVYLPIQWSEYQYEGTHFQLKGQVYDKKLESEADKFLSMH